MHASGRTERWCVERRVQRHGHGTKLRPVWPDRPARGPPDDVMGNLVAKDWQRRFKAVVGEKVLGDRDRPRRPIRTGTPREPSGDANDDRRQPRHLPGNDLRGNSLEVG